MPPRSSLQVRMPAILATAACLCALSLALQETNDDCSHPPMWEDVPEKAHGYIRSVFAPSMYDCAAECRQSPLCLSFVFDPEKQTCQRLTEERAKTHSSFTVGSGVFFSNIHDWKNGVCADASCGTNSRCILGRNGQPLCEPSDGIGRKCTRNDDCLVMMTSCYHGQCLCHPGYSQNITSNSCDRDCKRYADTMTLYKELTILRHNRKRLRLRRRSQDAKKTCTKACMEETSFVCKTVDFSHRLCLLSSEGYLDVTARERERRQRKWWMGVRRCQ